MRVLRWELDASVFTLRSIVSRVENAIITLSGPAIAISGIIAGIDLLTGGSMFKDVGWLSLTWAICLLLTLDFQVLMLGTRARRIYQTNEKSGWRKGAEMLTVLLIATAISSVSVQMQSIIARSQTTVTDRDTQGRPYTHTISIDRATTDMGINPVALIWERSALVLILIFMSGWFRDEERQEEGGQKHTTPAPGGMDPQVLAQQILLVLQPTVSGLSTTIIDEMKGALPSLIPAPSIDDDQIARTIASLVKAESVPGMDAEAVASAVVPLLLKPTLSAVRTTIVEEIKSIFAALTESAPVPPMETRATTGSQEPSERQEEATNPTYEESQPTTKPDEEMEASGTGRLEQAYQEIYAQNGGKRVSARALATKVHMSRKTVTAWLQTAHPENEARASDENQDTEEIARMPAARLETQAQENQESSL